MHPVLFHIGHFLLPSYAACVAAGVLSALWLAQRTAVPAGLGIANGPRDAWNVLLLCVFAWIALERLLLVAVNWGVLRMHPSWLLSLATIHHPLLDAAGGLSAAATGVIYVRWNGLKLFPMADCLAAPIALVAAGEQLGAFLAGSDYGVESTSRSGLLAVTYNSELAARWSGTPLDVPLFPVQIYAALGFVLLALLALATLSVSARRGDVTGVTLIGTGMLFFITECFRDWQGRGVLLNGSADIPQLVGLGLVLCGGAALLRF